MPPPLLAVPGELAPAAASSPPRGTQRGLAQRKLQPLGVVVSVNTTSKISECLRVVSQGLAFRQVSAAAAGGQLWMSQAGSSSLPGQ